MKFPTTLHIISDRIDPKQNPKTLEDFSVTHCTFSQPSPPLRICRACSAEQSRETIFHESEKEASHR